VIDKELLRRGIILDSVWTIGKPSAIDPQHPQLIAESNLPHVRFWQNTPRYQVIHAREHRGARIDHGM
jgi:hypothetical protein